MPIMKKDPNSGAIVFHRTKDEQEVYELKEELKSMRDEFRSLIDTTKQKED